MLLRSYFWWCYWVLLYSCFFSFFKKKLLFCFFFTLLDLYCSVWFSSLVLSDSLQSHGLQLARLPCPLPTLRAWSNSCPSSQWCHPTISSSVIPFSSRLLSFPASGSFQMSQFFPSGSQSIGASSSASVIPVNIQGWISLGLTALISLQNEELKSSPSSHFKRINSLALSFLYSPPLTSIPDHRKNHSFHWVGLCRQINVSAF